MRSWLKGKVKRHPTSQERWDGGGLEASALGDDRKLLGRILEHSSKYGRLITALGAVGLVVLISWYVISKRAYDARMERVEAAGKMADTPQMLATLRSEYEATSYPDVKVRILRNLGHFRDVQSLPLMIKGLDEAGLIRRAAAQGIARIGLPAAEGARAKLLEVYPDTDEKDRPQVVWALAVLREGRAADAVVEAFQAGLLQGQDGFDPKIVAEVLGPARLSAPKLLQHPSEAVRRLTAHALAEYASPQVVAPLSQLLELELRRPKKERSEEVIRSAAAGLGRTGSASAAAPLFALLNREPAMRPAVLEALRSAAGAPALATLIHEATDLSVQRDLSRLLSETHDPRAAEALAVLLNSKDESIRSTAALGLAELDDARAMPVLIELAQQKDKAYADSAVEALKEVAAPENFKELSALLKRLPGRKASVLRALGATGDPRAAPILESELRRDDALSAARGLAGMRHEASYRRLLAMVPRPENIDMSEPKLENETRFLNRRAAVEAVGIFGRSEAFEALMRIAEDPQDDRRLRTAAAEAMGACATVAQMRTVIHKLKQANLPELSKAYLSYGLWQMPKPELNGDYIELLRSNQPTEVRRNAALALGYLALPANDALLASFMKDRALRKEAAIAIAIGGSEENARALLDWMKEDIELLDFMRQVFTLEEYRWFDPVRAMHFRNGSFWRRARAAEILKEGNSEMRFGQAWTKMTEISRRGWEGPDGIPRKALRKLYAETLASGKEPQARLSAALLATVPERGLLLRARDAGGEAGQLARSALRAIR